MKRRYNSFFHPTTYFFLGIIALFLFQFVRVILNPTLVILSPASKIANAKEIMISGIANPQNTVQINGGSVVLDEKGNFQKQALLREGINEFTVQSKNFWGITKTKTIKLIFKP